MNQHLKQTNKSRAVKNRQQRRSESDAIFLLCYPVNIADSENAIAIDHLTTFIERTESEY